ncbi:MAG: hypothetical protein CO189_03510 [candidate division Zixibacteria bacterium CG_4_9_14_3_um_filter_46_8]|nr:MAG: hypothetical protein CO189_03510 [candidate division Zixibacteria bacterium CG_4_9_14_3_um_filter_46_8]
MNDIKTKVEGSFSGNLDAVPLIDVFQLLFGSKKSGTLETINGNQRKKVCLKSGMIVAAESSEEKDLLGQLLVKRGDLDKKDLSRALTLQRKSGKPLGQILMEMNLFQDIEVNNALKLQVEEIIYSMFGWESGEFIFHEGRAPIKPELEVPLNPMNVIMEATRRLDEWGRIEDKLPPENSILIGCVTNEPIDEEIRITKEEFSLLILIDGRKSFKQIIHESPFDRFTTARAIYRFVTSGLLTYSLPEPEAPSGAEDPSSVLEDLLRFHKAIQEVAYAMLVEYLGESGNHILGEVFRNCKGEYAVLDKFSGSSTKAIDYEKVTIVAKSIPANAILHKISIAFTALSRSYLCAIKEYLGQFIYEEAVGRIRKGMSRFLENRRQLLSDYGLEEELYKLLNSK